MSSPPNSLDTNNRKTYFLRALGMLFFILLVGYAYYFADPEPQKVYDYQFRIARALLQGELGLREGYPWLNELVPFNGWYYSVFPLGSVLCQVPTVLVQNFLHQPSEYPAKMVTALIAMQIAVFVVALSKRYDDSFARRALFVVWLLFGSWAFVNIVMGSAWQVALAFAMMGQLGAICFTLSIRNPLLAGLYFAIAFGNRTEILLSAPIYWYLLVRHDPWRDGEAGIDEPFMARLRRRWLDIALFCVFPLLLGVATMWYNHARFGSFSDFGYARIPGILNEYWYKGGFFTPTAIPMNFNSMFFNSSWEPKVDFPFLKPERYGGSVLSACPFLVFLVRPGGRDLVLRRAAWIASWLLIIPIWLHGNAGGVQFSYRYAMVILPWLWVILLDRRGGKVSWWEWGIFALSVGMTGWALYLFYWTKHVM